MMTSCDRFEAVGAYLDGERDARTAAVEAHLAECAACTAYAEDIRALNAAIRSVAGRQKAPESLALRLSERPVAAGPRAGTPVSRRRVLALGAVAASAAVAISLFGGRLVQDGSRAMASELFGDFATQLAAGRPLDLVESDPQRAAAWFASRLPFELPDLPALSDMGLRGGRLCWLLERRFAALDLTPAAGPMCLYFGIAEGLSVAGGQPLPAAPEAPAPLTRDGISGVFWRDGRLAYGLISEARARTLSTIAERLRGRP